MVTPTGSGGRTETTIVYGLVDGVSPTDEYFLESSSYVHSPPQQGCAAGSTCTGDPNLEPQAVYWAYRSGAFAAGKLYFYCGQETRTFAAGGAMTSLSSFARTGRIHR